MTKKELLKNIPTDQWDKIKITSPWLEVEGEKLKKNCLFSKILMPGKLIKHGTEPGSVYFTQEGLEEIKKIVDLKELNFYLGAGTKSLGMISIEDDIGDFDNQEVLSQTLKEKIINEGKFTNRKAFDFMTWALDDQEIEYTNPMEIVTKALHDHTKEEKLEVSFLRAEPMKEKEFTITPEEVNINTQSTTDNWSFFSKKPDIRNILLFGITGAGKSSLASTLSEKAFKESAGSVSETKCHQVEIFQVKDKNNKDITYRIIDTIGIGDTQLSTEDNFEEFAKVASELGKGINQVFFVVGGRFNQQEVEAFEKLTQVLFDDKVVNYTTIIRTRFPDFEIDELCDEDVDKLASKDQIGAEVVEKIGKKNIVHIDIPPIPSLNSDLNEKAKERIEKKINSAKKDREYVREKMLDYLEDKREIYKPENLQNISAKVKKLIRREEIEKISAKIEQLKEDLKLINDSTARKQKEDEIAELEINKQKLVKAEKRALVIEMNTHIIKTFANIGETMIPLFPSAGRFVGTSVGYSGAALNTMINFFNIW